MKAKFLIIGQVMVDILNPGKRPRVSLGGVFHAARGLCGMGQNCTIAYISPAYLEKQIEHQASEQLSAMAVKVGNIEGCPNVMLIGEPTEAGDQGYEYVLENERTIQLDVNRLRDLLDKEKFTEVLIFPDSDELLPIFRLLRGREINIHVDANFRGSIPRMTKALGRCFTTLITSTSSVLFIQKFNGNVDDFLKFALANAEALIFKENRGGSRMWKRGSPVPIHAPAFVGATVHSVGVGDCFDSVFLAAQGPSLELRLRMASLAAQHYAMTLQLSVFLSKMATLRGMPSKTVGEIRGISLPWELRSEFHVYIAAPDFSAVNVNAINEVEAALKYHNFVPHRPVKENGEVSPQTTAGQRLTTALKDIELLKKCHAVVAIPIYPDPGTYIEVGYALEAGIPVFLYAPFKFHENLLALELSSLVTDSLDALVTAVFEHAQKRLCR